MKRQESSIMEGKMLYSSQLMCIPQKTELSILCYISRTSNFIRRISRKDVENMNISSMIEVIKSPPRPLPLRFYSFLIKGMVRVYILKLKYCEHEIQNTLNGLVQKKTKKRKETAIELKGKGDFVLRVDDDFISGYSEPEEMHDLSTPVVKEEEYSINDASFNIDENFSDHLVEVDSGIGDFSKKRKARKLIFDNRIEISNPKRVFESLIRNNDPNSGDKQGAVERELIFEEFDAFLNVMKNEEGNSVDANTIDIDLTCPTVIETQSHVPDSLAIKEMEKPGEIFDTANIEINEFILEQDTFNFNRETFNYRKVDRAAMFYKLLELGNAGRVRVAQAQPYSNIYVEKAAS